MGLKETLKCPGMNEGRSRVPNELDCSQCGEVVEVWSDENHRTCKNCGTIGYNLNSLPKVHLKISGGSDT